MISFFGLLFLLFISRLSSGTKITLSGDLNVFNFQRVLLAARKTDTIALWLYAYFLRIDLPILTDAKTCSHYLDKIQRRLILTLDSVYQRHHHRLEFWIFFFFLQLPYLQRYADIAAGKCAPLYNCFNFVGGIIAHTCVSVLNEKLVFSHYTRVRGVKF